MTVRNVKKNLAALQDMLPGVGPYMQIRRGNTVTVDGPAKSYIELWKNYCGSAYIGTFEDGFTAQQGDVAVSLILGKAYTYTGVLPFVAVAESLPTVDWQELTVSTTELQVREALRRSYAEAGFNLVAGSFQTGFTLVNSTDVVLDKLTNKAYSGPAGTYPANTSPTTGGFVDLSQALLRDYIMLGPRNVIAPTDGSDATTVLQAEFNLGGFMFIPPGEYMIKAYTDLGGFGGVFPKDNSTIIFHPNAIFKAITNNQDAYAIINLQSVSGITIVEPNLVGDKDTHTGSTGEFGMGLYMRDSHHISILRPNISKCWGDGIYIGQVGGVGACTEITIDEPVIDECRRQGISIISADGLTINSPYISNIAGTPPSAGIDIEPNSPSCVLNRIKITNPKTVNTSSGIVIDLDKLTDGAALKTVDIEIDGHYDEGSLFGATFTRNLHPTAGAIKYNRVLLKNNRNNGILQRRWHSQGAHIVVDHPVIINPNRGANGAALNAAGIAGFTLGTDASPTVGSGNITLINPRVIFEPGITPAFTSQISFRDTKSNVVDKVKILDMVDDPATFIETVLEFSRTTCEITTSSGIKFLGKGTSVEQQNLGIMGKFSGSLVASGLTSKAMIVLPPSSLWKPGLIRIAVTCCATTSGTPAANSIGYSESLIGYRHKNAAVPVGINKIDTIANANAVITVAYFDSPLRAEVTVTMLASGNTVGWDVEAGGPAGYPIAISLS